MRRRRRLIVGLLGLAGIGWLAAILAAYYVLHKPLGPDEALGMASALADTLLALAILTAAGGLGRRLAGQLHPDRLCALSLQASLGLGVFSLVLLALGVAGAIYPWVAWLILLAALILFARSARGWLAGWLELLREWRAASGFVRTVMALIAVVLAVSLMEALAPPIHFDALVYHLTLPQEFVRAHGIAATGGSPYWGMPLGTEMLYTWALALGRVQIAAVLGWMIGVACLAGVIGLARTFLGSAGWVAAAALLSGETLAWSLGWAYGDWTAALHGIAILIGLDAWRREQGDRAPAAAGAAAAFALGAKYAAGLGMVGGAIALVVLGRRAWLRPLTLFVAAAGLMSAPWFLKNWLFAGAPLYPVIGASPWIDPAQQAFYRGGSGMPGVAALLLPIAATLRGVEGAPGFAASLGPLMLGLTPAALLLRRKELGLARLAAVFLVAGWITWAIAGLLSIQLVQSRLYYVIFPAWAVVAGAGFAGLSRLRLPRLRFGLLARAMVILSLGLSAIGSSLDLLRSRPQEALLGLESEASYRARRLGLFEHAMQAIADLGPEVSVISLWEARGLGCRPACIPDYWLDRWHLARLSLSDPGAILARWRELGATHLLVYRAGLEFVRANDDRYTESDWAALDRLLGDLPLVERIGEAYELYQVR
ncbi:MAG TPA: hypothetical protein VJJ46_13290 [Anaerolineales bacterium]|nr:hypothetical protein [Anaerolineales bacterium]